MRHDTNYVLMLTGFLAPYWAVVRSGQGKIPKVSEMFWLIVSMAGLFLFGLLCIAITPP
jgi:hypothetical protein